MSVLRFGDSLVNTDRLLMARPDGDGFMLVFDNEETRPLVKADGEALIAAFTKQKASPENENA